MAISTNQKPTIYRNLYENTGPGVHPTKNPEIQIIFSYFLLFSLEKLRFILTFLIEIREY